MSNDNFKTLIQNINNKKSYRRSTLLGSKGIFGINHLKELTRDLEINEEILEEIKNYFLDEIKSLMIESGLEEIDKDVSYSYKDRLKIEITTEDEVKTNSLSLTIKFNTKIISKNNEIEGSEGLKIKIQRQTKIGKWKIKILNEETYIEIDEDNSDNSEDVFKNQMIAVFRKLRSEIESKVE